VNAENQTGYITPVDAGNGNELYPSKGEQISLFNPIFGYSAPWICRVQGPWKVSEWGRGIDWAPRIYQSTSSRIYAFLSFFQDEKTPSVE
jgi:hypothetical protein